MKRKTKKKKEPFLKRPIRYMVRFTAQEWKDFSGRATRAGLSKVEYARRRIFGQPIADLTESVEEHSIV